LAIVKTQEHHETGFVISTAAEKPVSATGFVLWIPLCAEDEFVSVFFVI